MPKAIFLTSELPYPPTGGGKIRDLHLIRLLSERMEVEVLCFGDPSTRPEIENLPANVRITQVIRDRQPLWKRSIYPFRPYVVNGYSGAMEDALKARISNDAPKTRDSNDAPKTRDSSGSPLLWVSRLAMAQYIPLARRLGYRVVLDEHNVESDLLIKAALSSLRRLPNLFIAAQAGYYESRFCNQAHAVVATSEVDASKLQKLAPRAMVHVIPNTIDSESYRPVREEKGFTIFFSGTLSYGPNSEGLNWFVSEVLPRLRRALGRKLPPVVVAGANPSPALSRLLTGAGIEVHANPPSMLPFLGEAAVVVVPIRSGSGTRFKILEAMAAGRAVVSTGKGAEGLVLSPSYDIWIADQPDRFASAIIQLLENDSLRQSMSVRAPETVRTHYDWRCTRDRMASVLDSLGRPRPALPAPEVPR